MSRHSNSVLAGGSVATGLARVGRIPAAGLWWDLHCEGGLADDDYLLTGGVWSVSEFPDSHLHHDCWWELFDRAGYHVDGVRQPRPAGPLRLYRGSVTERRADWSWTDEQSVS